MRRFAVLAALALCSASLTACKTAPVADANHANDLMVYLKDRDAARLERETIRQNLANVANNCPKADAQLPGSEAWAAKCIDDVADAMRDLGMAAVGRAGAEPQMPAYQRPPSAWREFTAGTRDLLQGVTPLAGIWQADRSNERLADVQVETARINADREIAITGAWRDTTIGVSNVFGNLPPSLQVEGGYIAGNVSGDGAGIGNTFTDSSTSVGGDNAGNDLIRDSYNGNNRDGSPGPYNCTPSSTAGDGEGGGGPVTCQSPGG